MIPARKLKVCVVTGGRAEYGLLRWLIQDLSEDPAIVCQIVATGAHLVPEAGMTYRAIEGDGFTISRKVEMQLASDTAVGMAKSTGLAMLGFADAFSDLAPDVIILLGDRYEITAAALAAYLMGIPVGHISGGEKTEGAVDDALRHIITKASRLHFVSAEEYRRRVEQLGEAPETIFNVGSPGVDAIHRLPLLDKAETFRRLGISEERPFLLVTYHPVTTDGRQSIDGMRALLAALDRFPDHTVVMTRPNLDAGAREIGAVAEDYAAARPGRVALFTSLGQVLYLSAMRECVAVVGNSSSGIVEAPAMRRPTIDIGTRQKGRLKAASIIECAPEAEAITEAIRRALSPDFAAVVREAPLLYGDADMSRQIHAILKRFDFSHLAPKVFHDLPAPGDGKTSG